MTEFRHASAADVARLTRLATAVQEFLSSVGIPSFPADELSATGGVQVETDTGADAAMGVYLSWRLSERVEEIAGEQLLAGQLDSPEIALGGRVAETMASALLEILAAGGFSARPTEDEYRPMAVEVLDRQSRVM